jgi:hypothetical protein
MKKVLTFALFILLSVNIYSQNLPVAPKLKLHNEKTIINDSIKVENGIKPGNGFGFRLGALIFFSVLNPVVVFENKKIYLGTTRELTAGFGKYTKFRVSIEYSFIFRSFLKHHFRASAKYDIQLSRSKGEYFNDQTVVSLGAGYFADKEGSGIFPEVSIGFKIGELLLFYPHIKLRHTFMLQKTKPDITDFSIGAALGYRIF